MVQTLDSPKETEERLIYRIDDARFFSMTVAPEHSTYCDMGTIWYWDTKQNIRSKVDYDDLPDQKFLIDGNGYIVFPSTAGGDLSVETVSILYSTDAGAHWLRLPTNINTGTGPYFVAGTDFAAADDTVQEQEDLDRGGRGYEIDVDKIAHPELYFIDIFKPSLRNDARDSSYTFNVAIPATIDVDRKTRRSTLVTDLKNTNEEPGKDKYRRVESESPVDGFSLINVKTPSGWDHFRCEPMPKIPTVAVRKDAL